MSFGSPSTPIAACSFTVPSVSVPVLSEQRTSMLPKFSIEARRFTITLPLAIILAPCARLILIMAGKSCGVSPTASASEKRKESKAGRFRNTLITKMTKTKMSVTSIRKYPKRLTPLSNSVSGDLSLRRSDILPNSVSFPVPIIRADAVPLITCVPIHSEFFLALRGVSSGTAPTCFSTGYVSPVRAASSIFSESDSRRTQSAGTTAPAFRITTSPGTSSSTGTNTCLPSRSTVVLILTTSRSFATASLAPRSCQNPRSPLIRTMVRIIMASTVSLRKKDSPIAKNRMIIIGLLN